MNDDYLWDKSGEPDPEVERLERVLGKYRYQPTPLSPALHSRLSARPVGWTRFAAVAAAILVIIAGLWIFVIQNRSVVAPPRQIADEHQPDGSNKQTEAPKKEEPLAPGVSKEFQEQVAISPNKIKSPRPVNHRSAKEPKDASEPLEASPGIDSSMVAERRPLMNPFVDFETARHIERAQLLLRAFKNTRDTGREPDQEVAYEKQRSRSLLSKNILLRRDAEAKGNMPVDELLGSLEPFLLDIANLPDKPSNNEVRSIKERMQKKEIISALQVYSAPVLSQVF